MKLITLIISALVLSTNVNSATLTHSYLFNGNYKDSIGGLEIINTNGALIDGRYSFGASDGLTLKNGLIDTSSYSIEMLMSVDDASVTWNKLIDLQNLTLDSGLYLHSSNLNFFNATGDGVDSVNSNSDFSVVLTRDAGITNGYLNGTLQWSSASADSISRSNILNFFIDDLAVSGEAQPGSIDYLRIYDGALTAVEISNLTSPVPVPAAVWLFSFGLFGLASIIRRKKQ